MSLNFDLIPPLTVELVAFECLKKVSPGFLVHFNSDILTFTDKHNILCLNFGLITVLSSELPAFEHSNI